MTTLTIPRWPSRRLPLILVTVVGFAGCGWNGLAFDDNTAIRILAPRPEQRVQLPIDVRWEPHGSAAVADDSYFAVFVDREPMPPGRALLSLVDENCRKSPGCADLSYFEEHQIYLTESTAIRLDNVLDDPPSLRSRGRDDHVATIVRLDARGRRLGEAAWSVRFTVERS